MLAAGLLVWQASNAAFAGTTQSASNGWTSGALTLTNNGGTAAYAATTAAAFNETLLTPGSNGQKCLTVRSVGTSAGSLHLYRAALADSVPSLGAQIWLTIDEAPVASDVLLGCAGFPATGLTNVVTAVPLTALATTYAAASGPVAVALGTQLVAYRIRWTFASTGTTAGDNALQGSTVATGFTWELQ